MGDDQEGQASLGRERCSSCFGPGRGFSEVGVALHSVCFLFTSSWPASDKSILERNKYIFSVHASLPLPVPYRGLVVVWVVEKKDPGRSNASEALACTRRRGFLRVELRCVGRGLVPAALTMMFHKPSVHIALEYSYLAKYMRQFSLQRLRTISNAIKDGSLFFCRGRHVRKRTQSTTEVGKMARPR